MRDWSDEQLSAYIDDALDLETRAALDEALAGDARLRARLDALAQADGLVEAAFDAPMREPVPERFLALLREEAARPSARVVDLGQARDSRRRAPAAATWRMPVAAAAALMVGVVGGWLSRGPATPDAGALVAVTEAGDPALFAALDQSPSGAVTALPGGGAVTPVVSFATADGRFCREFELRGQDGAAVAVACREADGWRMEVVLAAAATASPGADQYAPVSGFDDVALDHVLERLEAGEPLGAEEERAALAQGWRKP